MDGQTAQHDRRFANSATLASAATTLFADAFEGEFHADSPDANWSTFAIPGPTGAPVFVAADGVGTVSPDGLRVVAPGDAWLSGR